MTAARFGDRFVGDGHAKLFVQFPSGTKFKGVDVGVADAVVNVEREEKVEEVDADAEGEERVGEVDADVKGEKDI